MENCFFPRPNDSKLMARWKAKLAKEYKPSRHRDLENAFQLACALLASERKLEALAVFQLISPGEFAGKYDPWFYVVASKMACSQLDPYSGSWRERDRGWEVEQRDVGEANNAAGIRAAIRNCPPPSMGKAFDISAHCVIVGYSWYYEAVGYTMLEELNLANLRSEHLGKISQLV